MWVGFVLRYLIYGMVIGYFWYGWCVIEWSVIYIKDIEWGFWWYFWFFFYGEDFLLLEENVLFVIYFFDVLDVLDVFFYEGDFFICNFLVDLLDGLFSG